MFEVFNLAEPRPVLAALGLNATTMIERTTDDAHFAATATKLARLAADGAHFILTGKASPAYEPGAEGRGRRISAPEGQRL